MADQYFGILAPCVSCMLLEVKTSFDFKIRSEFLFEKTRCSRLGRMPVYCFPPYILSLYSSKVFYLIIKHTCWHVASLPLYYMHSAKISTMESMKCISAVSAMCFTVLQTSCLAETAPLARILLECNIQAVIFNYEHTTP